MNDPCQPHQSPEILQAQWEFSQIEDLFRDLAQGAEIQHVQVRATTPCGLEDRRATLEDALELLRAKSALAIQIRYRFDGIDWSDTLMPESGSVRIIRTRGITVDETP